MCLHLSVVCLVEDQDMSISIHLHTFNVEV